MTMLPNYTLHTVHSEMPLGMIMLTQYKIQTTKTSLTSVER